LSNCNNWSFQYKHFNKKQINHQHYKHLGINTILKSLKKHTTINDTQIDHICTNAPIEQCHYRTTQTYCINHIPIYFSFKLPNYVPQFVLLHNTTKMIW
jgi:hypothetical protein